MSFLDYVIRTDLSGVQNFPSAGLIDENLLTNIEETGIEYSLVVDITGLAHPKRLLIMSSFYWKDSGRTIPQIKSFKCGKFDNNEGINHDFDYGLLYISAETRQYGEKL